MAGRRAIDRPWGGRKVRRYGTGRRGRRPLEPEAREAAPDHSALAAATSVQDRRGVADETGIAGRPLPGSALSRLSFSHIQRVIRKGELRVNGKRVDGKDRLQAGQAVRIPPLKLDRPKPLSEDAVGR